MSKCLKVKKISTLMLLASVGLMSACEQAKESDISITTTVASEKITVDNALEKVKNEELASVDEVLSQVNNCNETIIIRSQALTPAMIEQACELLIAKEKNFHQTFNTQSKPVADDNNKAMRANVYHSRDEFVKYATAHFTMPTNNGGMYLEGYPDKPDNQAEFVAYERDGQIWNLRHEYVHYLDGRFNKYGDYCNGLHDDHAGPEFCPSPNLTYPHIVWWAEGIGEYMAKGNNNPKAIVIASEKTYQLSELFNTSSNENTGGDRVYRWGYLAVRFMMENNRDDIEKMLTLIRSGEWQAYQELVRSWGTKFDSDFHTWLDGFSTDDKLAMK